MDAPQILVSEPLPGQVELRVFTLKEGKEFDTRKEALAYGKELVPSIIQQKYGAGIKHRIIDPSSFGDQKTEDEGAGIDSKLELETGGVTATDRFVGYLGRFDPQPRPKKRGP